MRRKELLPSEYNPYYKNYIEQVPEESELITSLDEGMKATVSFLENLPEDTLNYRYAQGKWTPKEVILHLIDTERVFAYRAMRFSRKDGTSLPGFEQDDYVLHSNASERSLISLIDEYKATRNGTITLFKNLKTDMLTYTGTASGSAMSTRAAGFIICGHERHHCTIIDERYI
ncbi:DinB family protein [Dokdonia sp. Hel_I_53]|uniref:DinB family protein n=1 Tax=Dokdonia sp. Hel_I_53 TaxID=1566287 RepID=UPI00119AB6DE|nr:DinB family protein [Dokdonia sp. Hel_I_53]TVZ51577.1 DinB family protein [Dokdonia sp. Hel_I_53]